MPTAEVHGGQQTIRALVSISFLAAIFRRLCVTARGEQFTSQIPDQRQVELPPQTPALFLCVTGQGPTGMSDLVSDIHFYALIVLSTETRIFDENKTVVNGGHFEEYQGWHYIKYTQHQVLLPFAYIAMEGVISVLVQMNYAFYIRMIT